MADGFLASRSRVFWWRSCSVRPPQMPSLPGMAGQSVPRGPGVHLRARLMPDCSLSAISTCSWGFPRIAAGLARPGCQPGRAVAGQCAEDGGRAGCRCRRFDGHDEDDADTQACPGQDRLPHARRVQPTDKAWWEGAGLGSYGGGHLAQLPAGQRLAEDHERHPGNEPDDDSPRPGPGVHREVEAGAEDREAGTGPERRGYL